MGLFKVNVWRLVYGKIYSIHSYLFLKFEAFTSRNSSAIKIKSCWEVFSLRAKFFLELTRRWRVAAWGIKISFRFQNWSFNTYVETMRPHFIHIGRPSMSSRQKLSIILDDKTSKHWSWIDFECKILEHFEELAVYSQNITISLE